MLDIEKKLFLKTKLMTFRNKVELREKREKIPNPRFVGIHNMAQEKKKVIKVSSSVFKKNEKK